MHPPGRVKNEVRCYPKRVFSPNFGHFSFTKRESERAHTKKKKKKIVDSRKESSESSSIARIRRGIEEVRDNRKNINTNIKRTKDEERTLPKRG